MTCCTSDTETVELNAGSAVNLDLIYKDDAGTVEDVTDDTFTVVDFYPEILGDATVTKPDPTNGLVHFYLSDEDAASLIGGRANRFRIRREFVNGDAVTTPIIWINVT